MSAPTQILWRASRSVCGAEVVSPPPTFAFTVRMGFVTQTLALRLDSLVRVPRRDSNAQALQQITGRLLPVTALATRPLITSKLVTKAGHSRPQRRWRSPHSPLGVRWSLRLSARCIPKVAPWYLTLHIFPQTATPIGRRPQSAPGTDLRTPS